MTNSKIKPRLVILDTDIGGDIDDTWALALLLRCPELDVKLITTATADTTYRAKIVAKLLTIAERTDIPIAIGINRGSDGPRERQLAWVKDYDLASYPGVVYANGIDAMIETIMRSPEPIYLLGIGPVTNVAAALEHQPRIAQNAHFIGMLGSIHKGHSGSPKAIAEYNVRKDITACQKVFDAPWLSMTITPLDTCGLIKLTGHRYESILNCPDPLIKAVVENYRLWCLTHGGITGDRFPHESSILYDTVVVYMAITEQLLIMKELGISISNEGYTLIDDKAKPVRCALEWKDQPAFEDWLVERLLTK